jgi:carbonic anhydrase
MEELDRLYQANREWSARMQAEDPSYFDRLAHLQTPAYLWIGCSDSRVPANQITGLQPGEVFVHRNVANVVVHTDLNCLSVMQFAIDVLRVRHILVVGHYGCGGVKAALGESRLGLIDNWLRHIHDVRDKHAARLAACGDEHSRADLLCELNAIEQAHNVSQTTIVRDAWASGQQLAVHAWIYGLSDGIIRSLAYSANSSESAAESYRRAIASR